MPASSTLFRSKRSIETANNQTSVPNYTVLLWHAPDGTWDSTSNENGSFDGAFNPQYYRRLDTVSRFPTYPDPRQNSYPVIKCVADDANWKSETARLHSANVNFSNTVATLLETAGAHNPVTMLRTRLYDSAGFRAGDTQSANTQLVYREKRGSHAGHSHFVDNVRDVILSINYGDKGLTGAAINNPYKSRGMQTLQIDLMIRDPKLSGGSDELNWLPKNVIVFGAVLPEPDYTRTDSVASPAVSANGLKFLPLLAKHPHTGVNGANTDSEFITLYAQSSFTNNHTHDSLPVTDLRISNRTNQTGFTYQPAGAHAHLVKYEIEAYLKSKILKAWITTMDKTPIADGIILLYAIGPGTGYNGPGDDSSILPPHWHFCDGNNGTPDLRDYYIMANFADEDHDVENNPNNDAAVYTISALANGQHSHYSTSTFTGINGTMIEVGGHGFEDSLDHTHNASVAPSFKKRTTDAQNVTNFKPFFEFEYTPPTVSMAFIMYNSAVP